MTGLSRAERALLPKVKDPAPAVAFNAVQFYTDLMNAARQLNVKTRKAVSKDAGVDDTTVARMQRGLTPDLATVLVLCDWAGLDPLRYLIRLAPAANDSNQRKTA